MTMSSRHLFSRGGALLLLGASLASLALPACSRKHREGIANQRPSVSISANKTGGPTPLTVDFTSSATDPDGTIASMQWDLGDGTVSSLASVQHVYASAGTYPVSFTATDDKGAYTIARDTIYAGGTNQPPTANAGADILNAGPGLDQALVGSGSEPDGQPITYQWIQTSGSGGVLTNATSSTASFNPPAITGARDTVSFTFTLTVTDDGTPPLSGSDSKQVRVLGTWNNHIGSLFLNNCALSGCHSETNPGAGRQRLGTWANVSANAALVKTKISVGGSMRGNFGVTVADRVINWIDLGFPQ